MISDQFFPFEDRKCRRVYIYLPKSTQWDDAGANVFMRALNKENGSMLKFDIIGEGGDKGRITWSIVCPSVVVERIKPVILARYYRQKGIFDVDIQVQKFPYLISELSEDIPNKMHLFGASRYLDFLPYTSAYDISSYDPLTGLLMIMDYLGPGEVVRYRLSVLNPMRFNRQEDADKFWKKYKRKSNQEISEALRTEFGDPPGGDDLASKVRDKKLSESIKCAVDIVITIIASSENRRRELSTEIVKAMDEFNLGDNHIDFIDYYDGPSVGFIPNEMAAYWHLPANHLSLIENIVWAEK